MYEHAIVFLHGDREVTFWRYEVETQHAVESAKHGFQEAYGYWPSEPPQVVVTKWVAP